MRSKVHRRAFRLGFTLIELIVVVLVMVIMAALAVPRVKLALENQERRETTRQLNAYITGAQILAAQRGRSVGVALERKDGEPNQCTQVYIVETPPPYSGAILDSKAFIALLATPDPPDPPYPNRKWQAKITFGVTGAPSSGDLLLDLTTQFALIRPFESGGGVNPDIPGERFSIRFDFKGPIYSGQRDKNNEYMIFSEFGDPQPVLAPPVNTDGYRYQIFRSPKRSSITPLQLPGTTVIDLTVSGIGASGFGVNAPNGFAIDTSLTLFDTTPVKIMFSPSGRVDQVFLADIGRRPQGPVHLLVGRNDQVLRSTPSDPNDPFTEDANLADLSNYWVSIGNRNGAVSSANNFRYNPADVNADKIRSAREDARSSQSIGGS